MGKLRCPYCQRTMDEEYREIGKDELGRPMQHKFAVCPSCNREMDLDLAREGIYSSPTSLENMKEVNGNHGLGILSFLLAGVLVPFIPIVPISIILAIVDMCIHREYKHTFSILAIIVSVLWYWYIFARTGIVISFK